MDRMESLGDRYTHVTAGLACVIGPLSEAWRLDEAMRPICHRQSQDGEQFFHHWGMLKEQAGWDPCRGRGRHVLIPVPQQSAPIAAHVVSCGFTLIEVVLTVAVMGIIIVGIGSALMIAARAVPTARSVTTTTVAAAEAMDQVVADLQYAVSVSQRTATMIEFTVHDRNGDDIPETIRYSWSGTAGAPLTRQYNGGTVENVLTDVREFNLLYTLKTISTEVPQPNESAETILVSFDANKNLYDYPIADTEQYAEYVFPALPANTISWKVTRVLLTAKLDGANAGQASVQLQWPTPGNQVSGIVIEEKTLLESVLSTKYGTQEFTFSSAGGLAPTQGVWIVVKWLADAIACRIRGQSLGVTATNVVLADSTDKGLSWSTLAGQSLLFTVYGTVTTAGTPQIQNTYYLTGIDLKLRASSDTAALVQTGVRLLNQPTVTQ
jgi:prepilin-type N-terminal cleavage/methylation domain-containing protein